MTLVQRFPNATQNYDAQNEAQFRNMVRQAIADASSPLVLQGGVGQTFAGAVGDTLVHTGGEFAATKTFTGAMIFASTVDINDALTFGHAAPSMVFTNAMTVTGTWANLGVVTTADINGGTIDGVTIAGGSINNAPIGQSTPAAGRFSTLAVTNGGTLYGGGGFSPSIVFGKANASSSALVITDHDADAHTWFAFQDGNNYITASELESAGTNGATYFRNAVGGGVYNNHVTIGNYGIDIVDGNLALPDDGTINFGATPDYSFLYRTSTTAFEFWTTNADGAGTDGKIFEVVDGDDMIRFFGEIIATNTGTLYDAPTAGFFPTAQFGRLNNAAAASLLLTNAAAVAHTWLGYADGNNYITADETASGGAAAATIFRNYTAGGGGTYTEYARINKNGIDGIIGATTARAGTFTALNANGGGALTGTWSNLGTVTTIDINGGTVDGTTIGGAAAAAGTFTALAANTLDVNNGIALGGGAAPTLGTIGGTGPTTAAQAQWLQVNIGGTTHWIPVWT